MDDISGEEKARQTAERLRGQVQEKKETDKQEMIAVKQSLAAVYDNQELSRLYVENAEVGSDNLSGEMPLLKIHATGRSKSLLADGKKPHDGWYYYKPLQKEFEMPELHILTISRGFRAEGMPAKDGKTELRFNQIMGGMIIDGADLLPFIMYFTGLKLKSLWEFGKEASKYTKFKPVPIPMFALTVRMGARSESTAYGDSWIPTFDILKTEDGFPQVVTDVKAFQTLRKSVDLVTERIESLIESKRTGEEDAGVEPLVPSPAIEEDMPF